MKYLVSLFSSEAVGISATGAWQVTADGPDQAVKLAKYYADARFWPAGSTWVVVPLEEGQAAWQAGVWNEA